MLQIHPYAQLAHWEVVTLTTVEDRCEKDHAPHEVSLMWLFESVYFRKGNYLNKNHKVFIPFSTQSTSRLSPEYLTIDLVIAIYSNTPPSSDWIDIK